MEKLYAYLFWLKKKQPFKKTKLLCVCVCGGGDMHRFVVFITFFSSLFYTPARGLSLCNQFGAIRLPTKACQLARKTKPCLGHIPMSLPELTHSSTEAPPLISACTHPPTFWSTQLCRRYTLWSHLRAQMGRLALFVLQLPSQPAFMLWLKFSGKSPARPAATR